MITIRELFENFRMPGIFPNKLKKKNISTLPMIPNQRSFNKIKRMDRKLFNINKHAQR